MGKLFKASLGIAHCRITICKSIKCSQWIQTYNQYEQSINLIKSWIKDMNRRMNIEDILILYLFIAQHKRINLEESIKALPCIVEPINNTWKDAERNLYKESVKKREFYDYAEESKI